MKKLFFAFFLFSAIHLSAQKPTINVVVCLYERIDFNTDYPLTEIGNINEVDESKVYDSLIALLGKQFQLYSNRNVQFEVLTPEQSYYFTQKGRKSQMSDPSRYGIDLSAISDREYWVFMNNHKADYLLFINYYSIDKYRIPEADMEAFKRTLPNEELYLIESLSRNRPLYSEHSVDFDIFDENKNRFLSKGRFTIPIVKYNSKTISQKGVGFKTLNRSYDGLVDKIWNELAKEIEEKRAEEQQ